ncbi:ImcF-related family protein [Pantoea phytobeneficialis]|uniref:ImcF-related family protein n=1 Tax=Pantoea phytobeneficialis TaxID=2052056 RepID=A0AAP9H883_9GAMM|nr:ImcF-related family protein [Pantoea phytobeneficialis]MDO6410078.1 ImcF-related family protein [Pantoea phytobeneficialis]QGR08131.1 type VI secretion protein VasK [Pantoea phytobeneficialis]
MSKQEKLTFFSVKATVIFILVGAALPGIVGGVLWWYFPLERTTEWQALFKLALSCLLLWIGLLCLCALVVAISGGGIRAAIRSMSKTEESKSEDKQQPALAALRHHLHTRYTVFWRSKVRLLLVTGEDDAIDILIPGLRKQQWLEGRRTVLIYGGDLHSEVDREKLAALRILRPGRPLDGIVQVLGQDEILTARQSDTFLRALENISAILRWRPPIWLWQPVRSDRAQEGVEPFSAGVTFIAGATPEDIQQQLEHLQTLLCERGMAQVVRNLNHDWLLRLLQQLKQGGSHQWQQHLTPWFMPQTPVSLRGLMFSLPDNTSTDVRPHSLPHPSLWQKIASDEMKGRRIGLPWQQTLVWSLLGLMSLWGAGMLVSFVANRTQVINAAQEVRKLVDNPAINDAQLIALHRLRNDLGRQQHWLAQGPPWYQRFLLSHTRELYAALLPWYGVTSDRLIHAPARVALEARLTRLAELPPDSPLRASLASSGYNQLKAWLMMSRPERASADFYAQTLKDVEPQREGISTSLWQSLAPDLWGFYATSLPSHPQWAIQPDPALLTQVRQVLLQQIGRRNAESTLYNNVLQAIRRNYADVDLEDMTPGTDPHRLFTSDKTVPGMFTRQAWEGGVKQAIEKAARERREEIDWVLSDSRSALAQDVSPEALQERLTQRYFTDFAASWLNFLNGLRLNPTHNIADVTDQLTLMSDVRQSPLIALINTLAWQGQTGQQRDAITTSLLNSAKTLIGRKAQPVINQQPVEPTGPLDATFGPLLTLVGRGNGSQLVAADNSLSLQTYLTRITRVRLRLQQVAAASDPQEMLQALAQTVFQGKSIDLTDTQQYGSLMAASLGEEWSGFGQTLFVQPLAQAWGTILQPSAISLNAQWRRAVVENWRNAFDGRYPFAVSNSDASLPMLAEFIRKDAGRLDSFLNHRLAGVLQKEGSHWVPDRAHSQGLTFNPAFLKTINQLRELADILFTDGTQGISFELQGRPVPEVVETHLTVDGQKLRYFNQMAEWRAFRWPGESLKPGTLLSWSTVGSGGRVFGDYAGTWGFIRWLEQGKRQQLDRSQWKLSFAIADKRNLQWILRTQMSDGPLALLRLRGFTLPDEIFSVDAESAAQALTQYE